MCRWGGRGSALSAHLVVVGGVGEGERQHALLLEIGLVDARERLDQHGDAALQYWEPVLQTPALMQVNSSCEGVAQLS